MPQPPKEKPAPRKPAHSTAGKVAQRALQEMEKPRVARPKRPKKKHPMHPNSLRALELNRAKGWFRNRKKCRECTRIPLKGIDYCQWHGEGRDVYRARLKYYNVRRGNTALMNEAINHILSNNWIPPGIMKVPLFRRALRLAQKGVWEDEFPDLGTNGRMRLRANAKRAVLRMLAAWEVLERDDDHGPWQAAMRDIKSYQLGDPGEND